MFQSVIQQSAAGRSRFGTGVWVSLLVHAGVLGGALLVSGVTQKVAPPKEPDVLIFQHLPSGPPQTTPPRLEQKPTPPKVAAKKPPAPRKTLRQPSIIPPPPAVEPQPVEPTPSDAEASSEATGSPSGGGEVIAGPMCPNCAVGPARQGTGEETVPFGAGMTPPQLLSEGVPVRYTSDAIHAGVRGLLIARCTITRDGQVDDCRVIKGLPFMDQAVLESLESRRYRPVTFQGKPVNALYTFNVKLQMQ
ncbi:TonB protein [Cystobacter fuscus DSM 2262]|uniref:TonB protein n=1 Tax=Cystobacter fuscus (strain ATCC 25194 / DSM 2262 / NBRC 100088 / M29) TaxID=1242864 RepID=S9NUD8_CYSF2|nr:energy transducer TonB [Cystobacter fuscus]EPX55805.1 TonB protein [Cystobacter fuscus DSM 2262]